MTGEARTKMAFLGTGLMGAPMSGRLLAGGFDLRVWNRSADKLGPLVTGGARAANTPAEAAAGADVVCLCLTDARAVEAVMFGQDGVVSALRASTLVVDFSTIGPEPTRALATRVA